MPTEVMDADILTKPLQGELFRRLGTRLLNLMFFHFVHGFFSFSFIVLLV